MGSPKVTAESRALSLGNSRTQSSACPRLTQFPQGDCLSHLIFFLVQAWQANLGRYDLLMVSMATSLATMQTARQGRLGRDTRHLVSI